MTRNENDQTGANDEGARPVDVTDGDVAELEAQLTARGETYARVTIVRREPPVSANVGDRAVVTADGELHGWIGGAACAQTTAISESAAAIEDGEPRLVGIAPDPEEIARPGLEAFPMHCHSEGVLELFIEPVNTTPDLLIVGDSPVARSLARLAAELAVDVTVVAPDGSDDVGDAAVVTETDPDAIVDAVGHAPLVVVASMGKYDARGVAAGVRADAPYIGLVASDTRSSEVVERAAGVLDVDPEAVREAVTNPAGVDIAAYTPAEIAASILAQVVDARSTAGGSGGRSSGVSTTADTAETAASDDEMTTEGSASPDELATDPVCGMTVEPASAPAVEHDGTTYYFCCEGCADSFQNDPASYLDAAEGSV
ncbi:XdhC family protein [Halobellus sp. H-GB7]|uniref:XdhC family protein n=1 Tax=Halobellus sp. H-GB7 TaxID=3069756 RepID=UPI0027B0B9A2|nr:XdhC family protein [Halobellus sp. H-GB7]MDQ2053516.1 XdhC family protein [Halobellus sp. H-GB7]